MSRHHSRGPRSASVGSSGVSLETFLNETVVKEKEEVVPVLTLNEENLKQTVNSFSTSTTTTATAVIPSVKSSNPPSLLRSESSARFKKQKDDSSDSSSSSGSDISERNHKISILSSNKNSHKDNSPLMIVDGDEDVPELSSRESKKAEKEQLKKLLSKNKKKVWKLVQCCLIPIFALSLLKRALESMI